MIQVRDQLETAAREHGDKDGPYPVYLENTLKELLRRSAYLSLLNTESWLYIASFCFQLYPLLNQYNYKSCLSFRYPVAGNMTVRTPHSAPFDLLDGAYTVPAATPIFLHMFSHHNSSRHWVKPKEFIPERWSSNAVPSCPFMSRTSATSTNPTASVDDEYGGLGFEKGSLSYFPFSAGERACAGKGLALAVLRDYLLRLAGQGIRMTPSQVLLEEDSGVSLDVTVVPQDARAMQVVVKQVLSGDGGMATVVEEDDGWAADEDEEEQQLVAEEEEEEDKDE